MLLDIEWILFTYNLTKVKNKSTGKYLTKDELDSSIGEPGNDVNFYLPLDEDWNYHEVITVETPIKIREILNMVYCYYKTPISRKTFEQVKNHNKDNTEFYDSIFECVGDDLSSLTLCRLFPESEYIMRFNKCKCNEYDWYVKLY